MDANAIFRTLRMGCGFNRHKVKKEASSFEKPAVDLERMKASRLPSSSPDFFGNQASGSTPKPENAFSLKRPLEISKVLKGDESPGLKTSSKKRKVEGDGSSDSEVIDIGEDDAPLFSKVIRTEVDETEDESPEVVAARQESEAIGRFRNLNRIKVEGSDIPNPIDDFSLMKRFGVKPFLLKNIELCKYDTPTPIQSQALPILAKGRDLIGIAPTGSGKTMAFLVPMLARLEKPSKEPIRGLILSPTRELAQQIYRQACMLSSGSSFNISILTKANSTSFDKLRTKKCDILITTPLRLVALIQEQSIDLSNVQILTLDEADKLLEMGFLEQVDEIMAACSNSSIQRSMFSATMPAQMEQLAKTILKDPIRLTIGVRNTTAETIKQKLVYVGQEEGKLIAIRQLIQEGIKPPVLVFVQSKERAQDLFHELVYENINVDVIHSDRSQVQRETIIKNFRMGKIWVLIATELVARGIDFKGVNLVINYDFPQSAVSYIHRIGRTGRAGRNGEAVTMFTDDDVPYLRMIAGLMRESGCDVPDWMLTLKKVSKKEKKKLKTHPVKRKAVHETPVYDRKQARKEAKKAAKERKAKLTGGSSVKVSSSSTPTPAETSLNLPSSPKPTVQGHENGSLKKRKAKTKQTAKQGQSPTEKISIDD